MQIKREFAVIVYQSGRTIGDGPKLRVLVQEGGAHLLSCARDPGIGQREGMAGLAAVEHLHPTEEAGAGSEQG
jgi:hypothetical protein